MFFLSKCLISISFFHTLASAKAETSPAWLKDRKFIYFLQQLLLGKVTVGASLQRPDSGNCSRGFAALWLVGCSALESFCICIPVPNKSQTILRKKIDQNINYASGFLYFLCACFEPFFTSCTYNASAWGAPNHILTLEEIDSFFLTSDRDLFTGKMNIKLFRIVNWYPFTLPNTGASN